jgi:hypothetical protein
MLDGEQNELLTKIDALMIPELLRTAPLVISREKKGRSAGLAPEMYSSRRKKHTKYATFIEPV